MTKSLLILGSGAPDESASDLSAAPVGSVYLDGTNLPSNDKIPALSYVPNQQTDDGANKPILWMGVADADNRLGFNYAIDKNKYQKLANLSDLVPIGTIIAYPAYTPPEGWLNLDGGAFDQETYPELSTLLGTNKLQDWRGRFPRGPKGSAITVPEIGEIQGDAIRNISGSVGQFYVFANTESYTGPFDLRITSAQSAVGGKGIAGAEIVDFDASKSVPTAEENRPYAIVSNFIIKAK
ncbi:tail fiber protein [Acetobacteraceae bacterium]|nr:tail fiber protein [Acetobacteraceae bacterium]